MRPQISTQAKGQILTTNEDSVRNSDTVRIPDRHGVPTGTHGKDIALKRGEGRGGPMPDWKRQYMYQVWAANQSVAHVARKCEVSRMTAHKYKKLDNWNQRLELEIQQQTQEIMVAGPEQETALDAARSLAISQLQIARGRALEAIMKLEIKRPADAWKIFIEALNKELELQGHAAPKEVNIILLAAQRYQDQAAPARDKTMDVTEDAEVIDTEGDE